MWYSAYIAKQECKQELKSNSGLFKCPVPSHPATIPLWVRGGQLSEATKMSTVGENICSNAPGFALKAVTDMTSTALWSRSRSVDLLACDLEWSHSRESSCLWRKKLTPFLSIVHSNPIFSSPLAQQIKGRWSWWGPKTRPTLQMVTAYVPQALHEEAHVGLVWTRSQEKNGFHPPHCSVVMEPQDHWQYWLLLAVILIWMADTT